MNEIPLIRITATSEEICASFDADNATRRLLHHGLNPREFVGVLLDHQKGGDALEFMAHALPVREGVWWGLLCMQHSLDGPLAGPDRAAAYAAVQWLMQPAEESRLAAKSTVEDAGSMSAAGAIAMAVGVSGGSIYPPELPFRAHSPFAPHKAVARAVKLASIKLKPIAKVQRAYVDLALQIAEGNLI